jgi:drug/metabolite transporter (DMT)-like permease
VNTSPAIEDAPTPASGPGVPRLALLVFAALVGFACNSLLCRLALGHQEIDAASFTTLRVVAGALALALLARFDRRARERASGTWRGAAALFAYAIAFSYAYLRIGAGVGSLIAFGAVQLTMIGWGIRRGERPPALEWLGIALALGGLAALGLRGVGAVDVWGALLMVVAGVAWGVYSLLGRGSADPLADTAGNFLRAVPMALAVSLLAASSGAPHATDLGVGLAVLSGALTSGVGYSLWYAALPYLPATRAAALQLATPVLTALAAVALLGETITPRLVGSGAAILGGLALVLAAKRASAER